MEHGSGKRREDGAGAIKGRERFQIAEATPERALVLHVELKSTGRGAGRGGTDARASERSAEAKLAEAVGLAEAIDLEVAEAMITGLARPQPATLIGPGKVEELAGIIAALDTGLVVVNAPLSAVQQRNLERAWKAKVLDRTGLILEIFGARARTREGRLQVELANLTYQKSRLVRTWTHLERQRGGLGFVGGPGETQIEADRRMIQERISRLERQLETVKRTRELHRESRRKVPYPIIALVGYTNAGKSTLFNAMTSAKVMAENLLFATLDPTMRRIVLPSGREAVLSDTVGFISDLPTDLIAAFRATLEEVLEADIIVHVRDITHEDSGAQATDVLSVLSDLGIDEHRMRRVCEVWNKVDQLDPAERGVIEQRAERQGASVVLASAVTGEGLDVLRARFDALLNADTVVLDLHVAAEDGAGLHWLYENAQVLSRETCDDGSSDVTVRVPEAKAGVARARFTGSTVQGIA